MVLVGVPAVEVPLVVILRDGLYWVVGVPQFGVPLEVFLDGLNLIPGPDDGEDNFGLVVPSSFSLIPNKGLCFGNGSVKDALRSFIFVPSFAWSTTEFTNIFTTLYHQLFFDISIIFSL